MDVQIGEISSTVRLTDRETPMMRDIVRAVLAALAAERAREKDVQQERRVGTGVRDAQEMDE